MPNYQGAFWFNYIKGNIDHNVAVPGGSDITRRFVEVRSQSRLIRVRIEFRLHPLRIGRIRSSCLTARRSRATTKLWRWRVSVNPHLGPKSTRVYSK